MSNLLHGHSWGYMPQGTGTGTAYDENGNLLPGQHEPNGYVTAAADALSVAGTVTGHASLGRVGAAVSVRNDHGVQNLVMTGASFVPVVGEAVGAVGIVYDVGDFAGHWITNNIMAPMINAIPGNTMDNGNGVSIPTPEAQCVASGMC